MARLTYPRLTYLDASAIDTIEALRPYRNLTDAGLRAKEAKGELGRFIAEGPLVVREALLRSRDETAKGRPGILRSILIDASTVDAHRPLLELAAEDVPIFALPREAVQEIVGFQFHRGVLACGVRPADHDWMGLARDASALVVLENLSNHDNVGSIFRSVAALAGTTAAVLLTPETCDPLYRKSLRVSIGQALRIRFARVAPWPDAMDGLVAMGYAPIALTPDPAAAAIAEVARDLFGDSAGAFAPVGVKPLLLIGAEGPGLEGGTMLRPGVIRARIPMASGVDSLNAGVAAAVAMSHLTRPG